jgi:hypothetical protein
VENGLTDILRERGIDGAARYLNVEQFRRHGPQLLPWYSRGTIRGADTAHRATAGGTA